MGLPWLMLPFSWHTPRKPSFDATQLTPEQLELVQSKFHAWYTADWDYGQTTMIFFCTGIGIMLVFRLILLFRARRQRRNGSSPSLVDKTVAFSRYLTARQYFVRIFRWYSPSLAVIIALVAIFTFLMAFMLGAKPYYWPVEHAMGHSPPIATRSGWISLGIMPFMLVFATKVNWIGMITGTSHEKLQVYHRWTALFMYITSLVHTFPFIVDAMEAGTMRSSWYQYSWFWTGVAALVPQTYLVALSWGVFRDPYYEFFKKMHYIASLVFMVFLFIHCTFLLTSWDYFMACLALYGFSWAIRVGRTHYNSGLSGLPTSVQLISANTIHLAIAVPKKLSWSPGQHIFIRFRGLGALAFFSSHPFTISSLPGAGTGAAGGTYAHSLELTLRVHKGITSKLANFAKEQPSQNLVAFIDGPYSGVPSLVRFDAVYLIAGGSGSSFIIPVLLDLAKGVGTTSKNLQLHFVLAVRSKEEAGAAKEVVQAAQKSVGEAPSSINISASIHVTNEPSETTTQNSDAESAKEIKGSHSNYRQGRPDLPGIVRSVCQEKENQRVAFIACGPASMLYDVRNAVAEFQLSIVKGGRSPTPRDILLHTENYNW